MKSSTLVVVLASIMIMPFPMQSAQAESSSSSRQARVLVDWNKLQVPAAQVQAPAPVVMRERTSTQHGRRPTSQQQQVTQVGLRPDVHMYASCVDGQGLIHSSGSVQYENCLAQTVGGRQHFVQHDSRGVLLMLDLTRYHR